MNKRQKKRLAKLLCYINNIHENPEWDPYVKEYTNDYCISQLMKYGFNEDCLRVNTYRDACKYILNESS